MVYPNVSIDSEHSTAGISLDDFALSADTYGSLEPKSFGGSVIEANNNNNGEEVYKTHQSQNTGLQSSNQNEYVVARKKCQNDGPKRSRKSKSSDITYEDLVPHFGQPRRDVAKTLGVSLSTFRTLCKKFHIDIWPCTIKKGERRPSTPPPTGPMAKMGEVNRNVPIEMPMLYPDETKYRGGVGYEDMGDLLEQHQDLDKMIMGFQGIEALIIPDPYGRRYQRNQELDGMQLFDTENFLPVQPIFLDKIDKIRQPFIHFQE